MSTPGPPPGGGEPLALSLDVSAVPAHPVGAGRYTIDLATALVARDDVRLTAWCRRADAARWQRLAAGTGADAPAEVRAKAPVSRPARLVWEQVRFPGLLAAEPIDVHHSPHYTMPERARVPRVVTIHDLTFFDHPEWHEKSKVVVFRRAIRVAARLADAIVCVSRSTSERLAELCDPVGRVFVVPHGVDHGRFAPGPASAVTLRRGDAETDDESDDVVLHRLGVRAPYVVFVGTLEPRKAVPDLVDAFDRVAQSHTDLSLVLVGAPGWGVEAVDRAIGRARSGHRIVRPGYVPDDALPALLRGAAAAAYPAMEEGFGLPALEALACGTPLVTTAGTAMAELSQGAAVLVAPGSVAELAEALDEVLEGGEAGDRRRRLGLEVAAGHTWEASAAGHVSAYRWAAAQRVSMARGRRTGPR